MLSIFKIADVIMAIISYAIGWAYDSLFVTFYIFIAFGGVALLIFTPAWPWWKVKEEWLVIKPAQEKKKQSKRDKK
jgi:hypothetical protein